MSDRRSGLQEKAAIFTPRADSSSVRNQRRSADAPPPDRSGFREKAAIFSARSRRQGGTWCTLSLVELPETTPEILRQWMQERITRHHRTQEPPVPRMPHPSVPTRIVEDVETGPGKSAAHSVLLAQQAVVRLLLQFELPGC